MGTWNFKLFDCHKNLLMFAWACCVPCGIVCMQSVDASLTSNLKFPAISACL